MGNTIINMRVIIFFLILVSIGFASCFKNCSDVTYSFDIHSQVYPDKDSIHVGDTIWIEAMSPSTVTDKLSGKQIDYSNAENMGVEIKMVSLHPAVENFAGVVDATQTFTYDLKQGSLYTSDQYGINYNYQESEGDYRFKVGCIPSDTGTYRLYISDAINVYRKKNKCEKASFTMSLTGTNQHFMLYQIVGSDVQPDSFALQHYYCFYVFK